MSALMCAMFLVALDRTIIATAIPKMTDEFHSIDDIAWYGSAFMLTSCSFQLLMGKIYTYYTMKWVFLVNILIFEVGSAICGAAPSSDVFIVGRALAGLGSAGIQNGAIILITATVPLAKRPKWMGLMGAVFGVASIVGPLLGGAFTSNVSWRWCFYINLPIGAVAAAAIIFMLKPMPPRNPDKPLKEQFLSLDPVGTILLIPCIVCLLLALQWGGSTYAWSDGRVVALLVVFGVLAIAWVLVQVFMQSTATVKASVIRNRSIIAAFWFIFCLAAAMMVVIYYVPIWFQVIKGVSAVKSGIDTIPAVLSLVVGAIGSGQIIGRTGYYTPFAMASAVIMPIGAGLISTWGVHTQSGMWIGYQIIFGIGMGLGMQQGALAAQAVLRGPDVPMGVSLMFFGQMLGGAVFLSVGQNLLNHKLVSGLTGLTGMSAQQIIGTGATQIRDVVSSDQLAQVLVIYNNALRTTFFLAAALGAAAAIGAFSLEWVNLKTIKQRGPGGPPPAQQPGAEKAAEQV
ncbi:MFS general substrate transporter [Polychaeton citri CBS 116435]|uniref:MFS general substrate transporter n=1 Tax=Polychaeton citri CBS 116435 TaxID=1314669 RepID=A0A9P4QI16_9PEZI|nr:MFS general substrate transporter [Polychaeton citri CBS 116435]